LCRPCQLSSFRWRVAHASEAVSPSHGARSKSVEGEDRAHGKAEEIRGQARHGHQGPTVVATEVRLAQVFRKGYTSTREATGGEPCLRRRR
jgi:hypothetical protein